MQAFDAAALWNKSRLFVDRALKARDNNDDLEYHLWAALSLELLGKAALATIHPALVADPSDFKSLLAACRPEGMSQTRSIGSKTVFDRLRIVSQDFDDRASRECKLMATRRNAELHSGESPVAGLDPRAWVPAFWRSAKILILEQGKSLEDWVGSEEAARTEAILADTAEVIRQTVIARIERRRNEFNRRYPLHSETRRDVEQRAEIRPYPSYYIHPWDAYESAVCPACGVKAWVFGYEVDREVVDERMESDGPGKWDYRYVHIVRVTCSVEAFECLECMLKLDGTDEIEIAELLPEFEQEIEEEPQYEEYGNE